jgi:signal transduction histidine kinase
MIVARTHNGPTKGKETTMLGATSSSTRSARRDILADGVLNQSPTACQVSDFLGIVAHELTSPVTTSKLSIQMAARRLSALQAQASTGEDTLAGQLTAIHGLLVRASDSVERLNRLVGDLLDVSRSGDGHLLLHLRTCDLAAEVAEFVEEQRQMAPSRTIRLQVPAQHIAPMLADGDRLRQVATNYLTNALRYSPEDQPVDVRLRQRGNWVYISVQDAGPGIPRTQRQRIWERFYRADEVHTTAETGAGLGLGLYICRMIIEQHHGRFGLRSAPGVGATFWFALPLAQLGG